MRGERGRRECFFQLEQASVVAYCIKIIVLPILSNVQHDMMLTAR